MKVTIPASYDKGTELNKFPQYNDVIAVSFRNLLDVKTVIKCKFR